MLTIQTPLFLNNRKILPANTLLQEMGEGQGLSTVGFLGQIVTIVGAGEGLSTVGFLERIVTFVGAGEVRSGEGTLASPMGGRWEAAGEQDVGRPKGPHPSSLPPRPYEENPLPHP
jgi:hypothetical protein